MKHIIAQNAESATYAHKQICAEDGWVPIRGDLVTARTASGAIVLRRVWDIGERVVFLCSERQFVQVRLGSRVAPPIGFPKRDVFKVGADEPKLLEA
jgi:hypothetical protein